jgi:hypothetical protein
MPYIDQTNRNQYDKILKSLPEIKTKGDLEFCIFTLMCQYMSNKPYCYTDLSDTTYAAIHCGDEFRRRFLDKREDEAIEKNGTIEPLFLKTKDPIIRDNIKNEIQNIIKEYELNCSIIEFRKIDNWYNFSNYKYLSEDFIREFQDEVSWTTISINQKLSEPFIKEFQYKVNWEYISRYQKLSEDFIREFKDKVDWTYISKYQNLSEAFIREFKDKVNWEIISEYQNLVVIVAKKENII